MVLSAQGDTNPRAFVMLRRRCALYRIAAEQPAWGTLWRVDWMSVIIFWVRLGYGDRDSRSRWRRGTRCEYIQAQAEVGASLRFRVWQKNFLSVMTRTRFVHRYLSQDKEGRGLQKDSSDPVSFKAKQPLKLRRSYGICEISFRDYPICSP